MAASKNTDVPNFGAILGPYIGQVPAASMPRFLARLERGAADRYRAWAAALPEHAETLLSCAASEEQIAIRAETLYPVVPEDLAAIEEALPGARDTYFAVFEGLTVKQQLALQAAAERQGAQAWQGLKRDGLPDTHLAELDALTALEIRSAERVEALVAQLRD
jgi:hypothetical protein